MKKAIIYLLGLIFLPLAVVTLGVRVSSAQHADTNPIKVERPAEVKKQWTIPGWGQTKEAAVRNALEKSRNNIAEYLREQVSEFAWMPSIVYIKKHLLDTESIRRDQSKDYAADGKDGKEVWQAWVVDIRMTNADYAEFQELNRQHVLAQKQWHRLTMSAKFAGLLLFICLIVIVYLKLEERTKGYLPRALFWGLVTLILLAGVGILIAGQ